MSEEVKRMVIVVLVVVMLAIVAASGFKAGQNQTEKRVRLELQIASLQEKLEAKEATPAVDVSELTQRISQLEAVLVKVAQNHNGLVEGLKQELSAVRNRGSAQVMSMSLIERVIRQIVGEDDYKFYVDNARKELSDELAKSKNSSKDKLEDEGEEEKTDE